MDDPESYYDRKLRHAREMFKPREMLIGAVLALLLLWALERCTGE